MWITFLLIGYCVLVMASSLVGGVLPTLVRLTHTRMQLMMSFVGGLMLGVALLHMLPHALAYDPGQLDAIAQSTVAGLLTMFFLIRIFHVHQHPHDEASCAHPHHDQHPQFHDPEQVVGQDEHDHLHAQHGHGHEHEHEKKRHDHERHDSGLHKHDHGSAKSAVQRHRLSWTGIMIGLSLHTLIDGMALAASVTAEAAGAHAVALFGLGTFMAVFLHKPLDSLSIVWLMRAGGWSAAVAMAVNVCFAMMCPAGALLFYFGVGQQSMLLACALGFGAGAFLCISLADLLPEVQFHSHDRIKLSICLLAGVAVAYAIGFLEPQHAHEHAVPAQVHDHGGQHHDH